MSEQEIEAEIAAKRLTAPRLTPALIDACIVGEQFHRLPGTTVTVCCLSLRNGFAVIGTAAAASAENFDEAIGRKIARENARERIWELEGYLLRERLAHGGDLDGRQAEAEAGREAAEADRDDLAKRLAARDAG
ncbi:MAG: Gp49 family protein [Pseudomonadota bacterium]